MKIKTTKVRQNLFGRCSTAASHLPDISLELDKERFAQKYNFNTTNMTPLKGRYIWEKVDVGVRGSDVIEPEGADNGNQEQGNHESDGREAEDEHENEACDDGNQASDVDQEKGRSKAENVDVNKARND